MDGWGFECCRVFIHGFASLEMLPLNILKLIIFGYGELNSLFWNEESYCVLLELC